MFIDKETTNKFCELLDRELYLFGRPEIRYTRTCWAEIRLKHAISLMYNIVYEYLLRNGVKVKLKGHTILIRIKDIETYVTLNKLKGDI